MALHKRLVVEDMVLAVMRQVVFPILVQVAVQAV
jgi:hypothetical protein